MKLSQFFIFSFISISLFGCVNSHQALKYNTLELPSGVSGPESIAFDCNGDGPYTGISDGKILKWQGSKHGWKEFAITSPFRIPKFCDGSLNPAMEQVCGRPLGLKFNEATCDLYIADAYFGLLVVGQNGGVAKQVAISAEGVPFRFTNALDIDQNTGVVYFTDTSTIFQRWAYAIVMQIGDKTGRLLKYDPRTKEVTVLLRGLSFSNGVALSEDKYFVLVTEMTAAKITRYWLQGQKSQLSDTFTQLVGCPDNIQRNIHGEFWVAQNNCGRPEVKVRPVRLNKEGKIVEELSVDVGPLSEVQEKNNSLWLGYVILSYIGVLN
ncbi:Protein strictosidine synthase-like 10 [Vitis vinifera]|uniref:Strictosidine synthase conserved region domain-containing protein n=3 Tax=Vitis vinifera TaxID=29760 RepID=D7TER5_VITVI|eukprot:XP_019078101.1 PREDICTED: protein STRICTOSIDINE SYNTHASE-LIKE 10 [Vitis vinifera]